MFNRPLYRAIRKYGVNNFVFSVLSKVETNERANIYEKFLIKILGTYGGKGYNATTGGDGSPGHKLSPEAALRHRDRMAKTRGKKISAETRKKISDGQKRRSKSSWRMGVRPTWEILKSSKAHRESNRASGKVFSYKGDKLLLIEISEKYNIPYSQITRRLYRGWSIEKAVEFPVKHPGVEINGERKSIREWSEISMVPLPTLKHRYERGWRGESLLIKASGRGDRTDLTFSKN